MQFQGKLLAKTSDYIGVPIVAGWMARQFLNHRIRPGQIQGIGVRKQIIGVADATKFSQQQVIVWEAEMSKNPTLPILPTEIQILSGSILPLHSQMPKGIQEYPTSKVKRAIAEGKHFVHCPFEGRWIDGDPIVDPPEGPRITNRDGATIYKCPSCGKVLDTVGNSTYQTGIGQNANPSSNSGRVTGRE